MTEYKSNHDQLLERVAAAGLSTDKTYRIIRGGFKGELVTIDTHNGFIGSDGTAWIIVITSAGQQMCRASVEEFTALTEEVPQ